MKQLPTILKKLLLSFFVGAGFIITFLVAQFLLVASTGVELSASIADLGTATNQFIENPMLLGVTALSMIITGALVLLWAEIKGHTATWFGLEKHVGFTIKKSGKRILGLILVLFAIGVITTLIFAGFNDFIGSASPDTNLSSLNSLYTAIITFEPIMIVWVTGAIIVFGILVNIAGALYKPVKEKLLPKNYTP